MLELVGDGCFRDLLTVSYDCGATTLRDQGDGGPSLPAGQSSGRSFRPMKPRAAKQAARHLLSPPSEASPSSRGSATNGRKGRLFLNSRGNKWTGDAVKCRFEDIEIDFGLDGDEAARHRTGHQRGINCRRDGNIMPCPEAEGNGRRGAEAKLGATQRGEAEADRPAGPESTASGSIIMRSAGTFITRKIIAGVDSHVVAKLAGHQSPPR